MSTCIQLVQNDKDYTDVDICIDGPHGSEWLFRVSMVKATGEIYEDDVRYSPSLNESAEVTKKPVPKNILKEFARIRPSAVKLLERHRPFTKEEKTTVLEIARVALADATIFDYVAEKMDLADEELQKLRYKIILATSEME